MDDPLSLPNPDWLRHDLVVTGPADDVAALREAAAGAGAIPWAFRDADLDKYDRVHALLHPPDGSPGLSVQGARALARLLRSAVETHHGRVLAAVEGGSRACPFDLHALLPVPQKIYGWGRRTRPAPPGCGSTGALRGRCAMSGCATMRPTGGYGARRGGTTSSGRPTGRPGPPSRRCGRAGRRSSSMSGRTTGLVDMAGPDTATDALPDDWNKPPRERMPVLHLDGFDGPMDLLLDLAERQRIDLGVMSMVALAEQFVAATEQLVETVPIEQRASWLVLATRLVLLRSRLLLAVGPGEAEAAERDAAAELRRLDRLVFLRAAAAWLEARPLLGRDIFGRAPTAPPRRESGYVALMEACLAVLRGRAGRPGEAAEVYRPVVADLWRVPDALARIRAVLADHPDGGELGRFLAPVAADEPHRPLKARAVVASTLVAGLELARAGTAELAQDEVFGVIHLRAAATGSEDGARAS